MAELQSNKSDAYRIAEANSKDCKICLGQGLATVYALSYDGSALRRDNSGRPFVARTMAYCKCQLGIHIRSSSPEDVVRRTANVQNIGDGYSAWSLIDPTEEPVDDPSDPVDADAFRFLWRRIHVSRIAKPAP